jgi:hypothetical protein
MGAGLRPYGPPGAAELEDVMIDRDRKPPANAARTGGMADLMAGDPNEIKGDLKREAPPHPQGAGGLDIGEDAVKRARKQAKRRLARVLR